MTTVSFDGWLTVFSGSGFSGGGRGQTKVMGGEGKREGGEKEEWMEGGKREGGKDGRREEGGRREGGMDGRKEGEGSR